MGNIRTPKRRCMRQETKKEMRPKKRKLNSDSNGLRAFAMVILTTFGACPTSTDVSVISSSQRIRKFYLQNMLCNCHYQKKVHSLIMFSIRNDCIIEKQVFGIRRKC